jgi:hypothetical protein
MRLEARKKITLLIPAAGKSSRYPGTRPKWMLTHPDGKMMIEKVLKDFDYKSFKQTYIIILKDHCKKFEADLILNQAFGDSVKLIILDKNTDSCPETLYTAIKKDKIKGQIIIKDTDCIVIPEEIKNENFVVGLQINNDTCVKNIQNKSFIVKNDNNIMEDIVEKSIVSNNICVGVYSLKAKDFIDSYEKILNSNLMFNTKELYVSHVISHLIINEKTIFHFIATKKYVDWGTLEDWQREKEKYKTYIFDIDGVLLYNYGKYGSKNWSNTIEPIQENVDLIKSLSEKGNEIIFMTSRPKEYIGLIELYLKEAEIKYKTILTNCGHSQRIIVNDFASTNPYPSCKSVSVSRNSILSHYIKS